MFLKKTSRTSAILAALMLLAGTATAKTRVAKESFGHAPDGTAVDLYSLADGKIEARIITYGAILVSLRTPDRNG